MDFAIGHAFGANRKTREDRLLMVMAYLAPEQIQNQPGDARADIYSAGVILYELLTGRLPFDNTPDFALRQSQLNEPVAPLRSFVPDLPDWLDQAVMRALSKNPAARYQNATEFRAVLEAALGMSTSRATAALRDGALRDSAAATAAFSAAPPLPSGSAPAPAASPKPAAPRTPSSSDATVVLSAMTSAPPAPPLPPQPTATVAPAPVTVAAPPPVPVPLPTSQQSGTRPEASGSAVAVPAAMPAAPDVMPPLTPPAAAEPPAKAPLSTVAPKAAKAPKPPSAPGSKKGLLIGLIALVIIAAGAGIAFVMMRGTPPPAATEQPASAEAPPPAAADQAQPPATAATTPVDAATIAVPAPVGAPPQPVSTMPAPASSGAAAKPATPAPAAPASGATRPKPVTVLPPPTAVPVSPPSAEPAPTRLPPPPVANEPTLPVLPEVSFRKVKFVTQVNGEEKTIDVVLMFQERRLSVVPIDGGGTLAAVRYRDAKGASYAKNEKRRLGFIKTTQHLFTIETGAEPVVLQIDGDNVDAILKAFEDRTTKKVTRGQ